MSFVLAGDEIRATWREADGDSATRGARAEVAREAIVELIREACERAPELKSDWFAVSYLG